MTTVRLVFLILCAGVLAAVMGCASKAVPALAPNLKATGQLAEAVDGAGGEG